MSREYHIEIFNCLSGTAVQVYNCTTLNNGVPSYDSAMDGIANVQMADGQMAIMSLHGPRDPMGPIYRYTESGLKINHFGVSQRLNEVGLHGIMCGVISDLIRSLYLKYPSIIDEDKILIGSDKLTVDISKCNLKVVLPGYTEEAETSACSPHTSPSMIQPE